MGQALEAVYYKCFLCGSMSSSPEEADKCCNRAKAQILCDMLKENCNDRQLEQRCNLTKAYMLRRNNKSNGEWV